MHNTVYEQGKTVYKQWLASLETKANELLLDVELLKPRRLEQSKYLAFEFIDYVKWMLRRKRVHIQLRTRKQQLRPSPPPDCTRWGWVSEDRAPTTPCIGWYDASDGAVLLLPDIVTEEVKYFITKVFRYYGGSATIIGNRLRKAGMLVFHDKSRITARRKINGEKRKVWVIPAAVFFDD